MTRKKERNNNFGGNKASTNLDCLPQSLMHHEKQCSTAAPKTEDKRDDRTGEVTKQSGIFVAIFF
jgi:hypothetical protein